MNSFSIYLSEFTNDLSKLNNFMFSQVTITDDPSLKIFTRFIWKWVDEK